MDLLGGRCRDHVPFSAYLFLKEEGAGGLFEFSMDSDATGWLSARQEAALTPDEIVLQAKSMCDHFGFTSIKLKAGTLPPDIEVACMFALYETFGKNVPLRIDPNAVWSVETSVKYGKQMEGILEYYEDYFTLVESFDIVPGSLGGMAFDGQYLWLANNDADSLYQIDVEQTAGLNDLTHFQDKLTIYPNPATIQLTIKSQQTSINKIEIIAVI